MLFSQSRALHQALRNFYRNDLLLVGGGGGKNDTTADNPLAATSLAFDDQRAAMIFITEHFHRQVFDSLERNPLSALLSLCWTICSTSFNVSPDLSETAYLRVWSPFICLVTTLFQLNDKIGLSSSSSSNGSSASSEPSNDDIFAPKQLFDFDDLRVADRAFIQRIEQISKLPKDKRSSVTYEQANSELFMKLLDATPFGTYQITNLTGSLMKNNSAKHLREDREWVVGNKIYTYVLSPVNVQDRDRFLALFARHETNEKLRRQVESTLRQYFPAYHARHGIDVTPWLISTHEADENGVRANIWQMQKSALVWILYHCLASLVTVNANPLLINDFIATVRCIDNFIECGLCLNHWNGRHRKKWDERCSLVTNNSSSSSSSSRTGSLFATSQYSPDVALLLTHNDIQESIDPRLKLTDAAVYALREDYLNFARTIVLALSNKSLQRNSASPEIVHRLPVNTSIHQHDAKRKDVCREPYELWSSHLEKVQVLQAVDLSTRGYVKDSLLKLQWDKLRNE